MCLVFCSDYIIPYIGSVLLFYFAKSAKKLGFSGVRSLSNICYIETFGAILGTFLAIYGTLWTQRKIDERTAKKNYEKMH